MSGRRRPMRVIAAASIAAASLLAPAAAVARPSTVPTLGAVNRIDASGTSYVKVRLGEPMLLNQDHGKGKYILPGLTVSDPAKFVAVAIVYDKNVHFSDEDLYMERPAFFVWQMPTGATQTIADSSLSDHNVLPAGTYRLTVVATGPVRLTWRLPLSQRGASVRTTTPVSVPYYIKTWTGPVAVISYAVHAPTPPVGQVWSSLWLSTTQLPRTGGGTTCWYNATDPQAAATENVPGVCEGIGTIVGPTDGVVVPPIPVTTNPRPLAGAMTIDATQKVNSDFLPQLGIKSTTYTGGIINAASAFHLWLPAG